MSKTRNYHQCSLRKENVHTITHLPEEYAKLGNKLKLKVEEGNWEGGWVVMSVGEPIEASIAEAKARAWCDIWKPSTNLTERGKK